MIVLIYGLSGSGKTTLARDIARDKNNAIVLDGDVVREGLNKDLGLSIEDRAENIRRIAEMAKILNKHNKLIIISAICPTNEMRNNLKEIVGENNLFTVYLSTPLEVCKERDVKGLYAKVGDEMTGINSVFEEPETYDLKIDTSDKEIFDCVREIERHLEIANYPRKAMKKYNFFNDKNRWVINYRHKYAYVVISKCASKQLQIWCEEDNVTYGEYIYKLSKLQKDNRLVRRNFNIVDSVNEVPEGFIKFAVYRDPIDRFYSACHFPGYDAKEVIKEFTEYVDDNGVCNDNYIRRQSDCYSIDNVDYIVNISDLNDFLKTVCGDDSNRTVSYLLPHYEDVDLTLSDEELQKVKEYYGKDWELEKSDKFWKNTNK